MSPQLPLITDDRFAADCSRCFGLCCVALAFGRSAEFAIDKPAGRPCVHLDPADRCGIHARLVPSGFRGCVSFDCLGAGPQLSERTFGGTSWRDSAGVAAELVAAFGAIRRLQELLFFLAQAARVAAAGSDGADGADWDQAMVDRVGTAVAEVTALVDRPAAEVAAEDFLARTVGPLERRVDELLRSVSAAHRARAERGSKAGSGGSRRRRLGPRPDLIGANLAGADLRGTDLRGALLIAANLAGADLRWCDLIGADLRDADLRGARLDSAIFLTPMQLASARGDASTELPDGFGRPHHWG